ncbi:Alpha/Beta hydrolase protein [Pilobolus umbonatus]|nr:Alpha/Beta hydrolase protein [Pilobolus umbonatus]
MSFLERKLFKKLRKPALAEISEDGDIHPVVDHTLEHEECARAEKIGLDYYSPLSWEDYFDECLDISIPGTDKVFRVYRTMPAVEDGPLFVMHHGAGSSALSFGVMAKTITGITEGKCGVMAIDCRGHGATRIDDDRLDYSLDTLSNDLIEVINTTVLNNNEILLVGHSMGGAVVVDAVSKKKLDNITGIVVIDVSEGVAMNTISKMKKILNARPTDFNSIEEAIVWSVRSDTLHDTISPRLSIPALLRPEDDKYTWITDLKKTIPFWEDWYSGMSEKFIKAPTSKLLLLTHPDSMDTTLTVGQMQGKFQLSIVNESYHFIHEDQPNKVAGQVVDFWNRHQRSVLPARIKDILKNKANK